MSIDPLRLAESGAAAALILGSATLSVAWNTLDQTITLVLAAMWLITTSGVYALHAVTFDCLRLTGQQRRQNFSVTRGRD
ncbi:hypothetical protein GCM10010172_08510 [Paractinoplanes ferrugineus]|uniref:Uncharacterized protein n=1 Tax=Paractinoplanes ferrugineus TaxID=113564 RepID=A0A919J9Y4_9ACTN|nr:hypothetical protein [Actinoplanes ferrugineus]GIE15384.1 hypothetical protein Afe05nite_72240 [Actinoplanes ferrugineus]